MRRLFRVTIFVLVFGFFLYRLAGLLDQVRAEPPTFSFLPLVVLFLPLFLGFICIALSWHLILRGIGIKTSFRDSFGVWTKAEITKYIPGSFWPMTSKVFASKRNRVAVSFSTIVEQVFKILASLSVAIILSPWARERINPTLTVLMVIISLVIIHPKILGPIVKRYYAFRKKAEKDVTAFEPTYDMTLLAFIIMLLAWLLFGTAFWLFVTSISQLPLSTLPYFIGAFAISWLAGFLVFFLPGGIGVREGLLVLLLLPFFSEATAIVIVLAARIWWMVIGDMGIYLTGALIRRQQTGRERNVKVVSSTSKLSEGSGVVKNVPGNYFPKHQSGNPLIRWLMDGFHDTILGLVAEVKPVSILDVGCGEGHTTKILYDGTMAQKPPSISAIDLEKSVILQARKSYKGIKFRTGSIYSIPFKKESFFDLVTATEVLEHLDDPELAIKELRRATKHYVLISVPNEPWWRIANIMRLHYLSRFGNTPGHVQHWSYFSLHRMLKPHFKKVTIRNAIMWNIALCEK